MQTSTFIDKTRIDLSRRRIPRLGLRLENHPWHHLETQSYEVRLAANFFGQACGSLEEKLPPLCYDVGLTQGQSVLSFDMLADWGLRREITIGVTYDWDALPDAAVGDPKAAKAFLLEKPNLRRLLSLRSMPIGSRAHRHHLEYTFDPRTFCTLIGHFIENVVVACCLSEDFYTHQATLHVVGDPLWITPDTRENLGWEDSHPKAGDRALHHYLGTGDPELNITERLTHFSELLSQGATHAKAHHVSGVSRKLYHLSQPQKDRTDFRWK